MFGLLPLLSLLPHLLVLNATPVKRDGPPSIVDLSNNTGTPAHLASGILAGIPLAANQIPSNFYTDMGFNYERTGGSQLPEPARGWIWGLEEYQNRFAAVVQNYQTARQYGANFILLSPAVWGADGLQNSTAPYPGDNGDWSFYDAFLDQMISDIQTNNMLPGLVFDIWNEPDGGFFWTPSQDQYLQMWGRTYDKLQSALPELVLSGPTTAGQPALNNGWWTNWAAFVQTNNSAPQQYVWHMETGGGSMNEAYDGFRSIQAQYNLPDAPVNINEYAVFNEQVPAGSAWWISQMERYNAAALRGNWLGGYQFHDFLASLLSKPGAPDTYSPTGTGYYPNGDYQVYKYYANMTGYRVGTQVSSDYAIDTFATVDTTLGIAKILTGVRLQTGTWAITLNSLSSIGFPTDGSVNIQTYGFPDNGHYGEVDGPNNLGVVAHTYSGDSVTFPIYQTDTSTAYAFEITLP